MPQPSQEPLTSHPLPGRVLYASSARVGGSGLDSVVYESLLGLEEAGILSRAITYGNRQRIIPSRKLRSLALHPVRLLSNMESPYYYGAKRQYVDWIASRELEQAAQNGYDFFHGWSGDALRALRVARRKGIPSVLEIATWHRNKGKQKPWITPEEEARLQGPFLQRLRNSLLVNRQRVLEEYELADLILVLSEKAIETFLAAGIAREKLFKIERGVDVERFTPAPKPPELFRAVFVGALIKRKGVHHLLEAWHRLGLKNAELVLVGAVHNEIRPILKEFAGKNSTIRVAGFLPRPESAYQEASVHLLPSTCEGSAKTTYEAAACGLAQITTRESGDVVIDGLNGLIVPPDDVDALAAAIEHLYHRPEEVAAMGAAGRERVVGQYTWAHFRSRLLEAYRVAMTRARGATPHP